jgi:hypothetical protein
MPASTVAQAHIEERRLLDEEINNGGLSLMTWDEYRRRYCERRSETPMERLIRSKFEFDEGWSFHVAEELAYGQDSAIVQQIGSCVGASHVALLAAKLAHEVLLEGDPEEPWGESDVGTADSPMPWMPWSYQAARCYEAGWWGDSSDGSYCSVQIAASQKHGIVPCCEVEGVLGSPVTPYPNPSGSYTRAFNRKSKLDPFLPVAAKYPLKDSTVVSSGDQVWESITVAKTPIQICSGWGFAYHREQDGLRVFRRSGSWSHSMQIIGAFSIGSNRYECVRNQWGRNAHGQPGRGFPGGCFIITHDTMESWIRDANAMTIGELVGIPSFAPIWKARRA